MADNQKALKFKKNPFHDRIHFQVASLKNNMSYTIRDYRDRYFFPDEWMVFFDSLKKKQRFTFHFLINTGCRINEAKHVLIKDIDFERNNIVFRWTKSRNSDGSRRIRTIPISSEFSKYLKRSLDGYPLGFQLGGFCGDKECEICKNLNQEDKNLILSTPAANIAMKKTLQIARIPDWKMFSIHNIRKTTEMFLMALGVPGTVIEKHMGHSLAVASRFYVSPDIFDYQDRKQMREIIGDLYSSYQRW